MIISNKNMTGKGLFLFFYLVVWSTFAFGQAPFSTIVLDGDALLKNRRILEKQPDGSLKSLIERAGSLAKSGKVYSVMNKEQVPPSGDRHDYMSQAPYWWPDPSRPNGLPYIRRDGERNPELNKISDSHEMDLLIEEAELSSIAYFLTRDEKYARHSANLIRTWFIDPKTRQNPNLKFGQGIPGITTGRGIGLIETRELYRVIDAAILLEQSKSWTAVDRQALKKWFADFLKWMRESDIGRDEADEKNNHGTYYDVQIISFALYAGQPEIARQQIEVSKQRLQTQLEKDGSQPHELARTLSWGYVNMNLLGFFTIARLAENLQIDLWNFETADGKSIRKAFDWLLPFVKNEKSWTHQQIKTRSFEQTVKLLGWAARKYKNPEYLELARKLDENAFRAMLYF